MGNKKFRKNARTIDQDDLACLKTHKRKKIKRKIKVKITMMGYGNSKISYNRSYRTIRDLNNAIKRPNVIRYMILD